MNARTATNAATPIALYITCVAVADAEMVLIWLPGFPFRPDSWRR